MLAVINLSLTRYFETSGFGLIQWPNLIMIGVGLLFLFLAIRKGFEPLLLVPIGFGILLGNIPYDARQVFVSVYDGPVSEDALHWLEIDVEWIEPLDQPGLKISLEEAKRARGWTDDGPFTHAGLMQIIESSREVRLRSTRELAPDGGGRLALELGRAILLNAKSKLTASTPEGVQSIYWFGQGRHIVVASPEGAKSLSDGGKHPELWSQRKQDPFAASVLWWLYTGVGVAGIFPPLIFLGIGALTDFGPMLSRPKTLLLGAGAQFGIFAALMGALIMGFTQREAGSIAIIGGADGPTAIFICSQLAPDLLGAVALAAYSYMAMVPLILPPVVKLLTTRSERMIRMSEARPVSRRIKIVFPIAGLLITTMIAPAAIPLLGMLFLGNLLRESLVTERLAKTAGGPFIDGVTILLGVTVGAKTSAANFLTVETIGIFVLGILAFAIAAGSGVLTAKLMNLLTTEKVNPMIGAAGVSAVPMSARVVHKLGQEADPHNYLLMHAMGPNVAGVIGSAVAAGVLLSSL